VGDQPQAGFENHERGIASVSAKAPPCANHGFGSLFQELLEPHQRRGARRAGSDLALGHNQHSTTHCLLLSGSGRGRLLPLLVGSSLSRWIDLRLTLSALETALWLRLPELELIHHFAPSVPSAYARTRRAPLPRRGKRPKVACLVFRPVRWPSPRLRASPLALRAATRPRAPSAERS
jgi:hypothetical protein